MKKIKYLLLLIVGLLGIGFSYSYNNVPNYVDYSSLNGDNISFLIHSYGTSPVSYYNSSNELIPVSPFYYMNSDSFSFNLSNYTLTGTFISSSLGGPLFVYNTFNGFAGGLYIRQVNHSSYLVPLSSSVGTLSQSDYNSGQPTNGVYVRLFSDSDCIKPTVLSTSLCSPSNYFIHYNSGVTISSFGAIDDTKYDDVRYGRGPVSSSVGYGYSFGFVDGTWQYTGTSPNRFYYLTGNDFFHFRSVIYSGNNFSFLDNVLLFRLNNNLYITGNNNYQVFALSYTGNIDNYSLLYSIYMCPTTAENIYGCFFIEGGTIDGYQNLSGQPYFNAPSSTGASDNLFYFLTYPRSTKFYNRYFSDENKLTLTRQTDMYSNNSIDESTLLNRTHFTTISLFLDNSNGYDVINGGSSSIIEPIFDYNSYVINDLIVCYITSGEICSYNTFNRSAFESTFDVSDSVWNGTTGFLLGGNASLFLKEFCLNSSLIDYPYCSQLDLYSGSAIFIDYANGLLSYQILGDGIIVSIDGLGSGQLGNTSCWGGNCSSVNTGLPDFIRPSDSEYYSGIFIDTGYFDDFYNLNITGYFMRCPFSYESNRVVIGQAVINKLGGRDPFVFINCMIAAFNEGKKFIFLNHIDFPGPLMSLTGSDHSPILGIEQVHNRKILFGFFDCLLSFGLLLLIRFFYRLFK